MHNWFANTQPKNLTILSKHFSKSFLLFFRNGDNHFSNDENITPYIQSENSNFYFSNWSQETNPDIFLTTVTEHPKVFMPRNNFLRQAVIVSRDILWKQLRYV